MPTEFTKLNNTVITPILKTKGFRKVGKYKYGVTFDRALYKSSDKQCQVIFPVHPYDYPFHGIRFEEISHRNMMYQKHYLHENGDLGSLINALARDLKVCAIDI